MPASYQGPECPHCGATLHDSELQTGAMTCHRCRKTFEATAFRSPQRPVPAAQLVHALPESGSACAMHARNAAVASCQRCGLFICALCDMNVGSGSYCPACFDRLRSEDGLQSAARRYRDYTRMAGTSVIAGIMMWFLAVPFGALALYYGVKGFRQRRDMGHATTGAVVAIVFAGLQVFGGIALIGFVVYAFTSGT
jgi:hypothetical protein